MQEHTAKKLRLSILLWLLLLALLFPYLIHYYEQQQVFQWQEMVQPHWEEVVAPPAITVQGSTVDVVEWKTIEVEAPADKAVEVLPEEKVTNPNNPGQKKTSHKVVTVKKNNGLTLNLPDNLYRGQTAEWEEKKQMVVPDFFAPKKEEPSRYQLGGKLIIDEEKQKQQPDASYIDTVKGAEVNIQIKTP